MKNKRIEKEEKKSTENVPKSSYCVYKKKIEIKKRFIFVNVVLLWFIKKDEIKREGREFGGCSLFLTTFFEFAFGLFW